MMKYQSEMLGTWKRLRDEERELGRITYIEVNLEKEDE